MQDLHGARISYKAALKAQPHFDLEKKIRIRIGDLLLSAGHYTEAKNYFAQESLSEKQECKS